MCGIVGITSNTPVCERLLSSLRRLEYRGYDSAGIAVHADDTTIRRRALGKLSALEDLLKAEPIDGTCGIGHTRWATHGKPTVANAHPHQSGSVTLVHNGIIENYRVIRDELIAQGISFEGESDTEVITHLLNSYIASLPTTDDAIKAMLERIDGAFALAIMITGDSDTLYCARKGSPLVIGLGDDENYIGSDAMALSDFTQKLIYLEEGDWARVTPTSIDIFDENNKPVNRETSMVDSQNMDTGKGNYRHYMLKEIYEQPTVVGQTLGRYIDPVEGRPTLPPMPFDLAAIPKITLIACGTSFYAAEVARYWFEQIARVTVEVDIASEYRYRDPIYVDGGMTIFISQSGETADTLAALKHAKTAGQIIGVIVNVAGSSMAREADVVLPTYAGPEIGVASTKAFTCQLAVLAAFAIALGTAREQLSPTESIALTQALEEVPKLMAGVLNHHDAIERLSKDVAKATDVLFLGRGKDFPIAMEGALKLKEISYIHAEGYAAGEMKHGPIALIDEKMPVVVIAPTGPLFEKTASNMQEVLARGGKIILISDAEGIKNHHESTLATIEMPYMHDFITPLVYVLPAQLLAYHTAVAKDTDIDQPRNLAKSVTVE